MGRLQVTVKHVNVFTDRHGRERIYLRVPGAKAAPLPGPLGSPAFVKAYSAALAKAEAKGKPQGEKGTLKRLLHDYYASSTFLRNQARTQSITKAILERFAAENGHRSVAGLKREYVEKAAGKLADTPGAANNLLKRLHALMEFAIKNRWRDDNPVKGVTKFKKGRWHTWTEKEIVQFEEQWPVGTRERTAFALALYTGQRRADVAAMIWRNYDEKAQTIEVAQLKGEMEQNDERLVIGVHPVLREALSAWPKRHFVILATGPNRGTSPNGLGNMMSDAIRTAGLPKRCVMHGLRKAAARRLAEVGCSAMEVASITGHKTLSEVERYTRDAARTKLARSAMDRLTGTLPER